LKWDWRKSFAGIPPRNAPGRITVIESRLPQRGTQHLGLLRMVDQQHLDRRPQRMRVGAGGKRQHQHHRLRRSQRVVRKQQQGN
jgi:hypothetical protein